MAFWDFKLARNRNSPGDEPPKWGPLGRTGGLVLILVVVAFLFIGVRIGDGVIGAV